MPQRNFSQLWNGGERPEWAGPVHVESRTVFLSHAHSDARPRPPGKPARTDRPLRIRGIVVPVATRTVTARRGTAMVPGRDLTGMPDDRGHAMALSLGAPNVSDIMVDQPRLINQELKDGNSEVARSSELSWRGMEVYALACAMAGLNGMAEPSPNEEVTIRRFSQVVPDAKEELPSWRPSRRRRIKWFVNGYVFAPFDPDYYQEPHNLPSFTIGYSAILDYKDARRGNSPSKVTVILSLIRDHQEVELCRKEYEMAHTISQIFRMYDQRQARLRGKRDRAIAAFEHNEERLRKRPRTEPEIIIIR